MVLLLLMGLAASNWSFQEMSCIIELARTENKLSLTWLTYERTQITQGSRNA